MGVDQDGEVVECQLESGLVSKVSFKFNRDCDRPDDIAALLVRAISVLDFFIDIRVRANSLLDFIDMLVRASSLLDVETPIVRAVSYVLNEKLLVSHVLLVLACFLLGLNTV